MNSQFGLATTTNRESDDDIAKENKAMKKVTAFEAAQSLNRAVTRSCNTRLASGKMIDEDGNHRRTYHAVAEEVLQEVALFLFTTYGNEIDIEDETIMYEARKCANRYQALEQRAQGHFAYQMDMDEMAEYTGQLCPLFADVEAAAMVEDMLSYMPEKVRKCFVLRFDLGMTLDAVAARVKLNRRTVVSRLADGIEIASQYLNKHGRGLV